MEPWNQTPKGKAGSLFDVRWMWAGCDEYIEGSGSGRLDLSCFTRVRGSGGSICRVLHGSEALGGSFVRVLRVGEALGGSRV